MHIQFTGFYQKVVLANYRSSHICHTNAPSPFNLLNIGVFNVHAWCRWSSRPVQEAFDGFRTWTAFLEQHPVEQHHRTWFEKHEPLPILHRNYRSSFWSNVIYKIISSCQVSSVFLASNVFGKFLTMLVLNLAQQIRGLYNHIQLDI